MLQLFSALLLPLIDGQLYKLDFKLCPTERHNIYWQERFTQPDKDLQMISIKNCQQEIAKPAAFNVTYCDHRRLDINTTDFWSKKQVIRVDAEKGKIGICKPDVYSLGKDMNLLVKRRCSHYKPKASHPIRVYLVCDKRLLEQKMVLVVSEKAQLAKDYSIEAMAIGWFAGCVLSSIAIVVFLCLLKRKWNPKMDTAYRGNLQSLEIPQPPKVLRSPTFKTKSPSTVTPHKTQPEAQDGEAEVDVDPEAEENGEPLSLPNATNVAADSSQLEIRKK